MAAFTGAGDDSLASGNHSKKIAAGLAISEMILHNRERTQGTARPNPVPAQGPYSKRETQ